MTQEPSSQNAQDGLFALHTRVPGFGTIEAVKTSGGQRDYLLQDSKGTVTWLDHEAVKAALRPAQHPTDDELRKQVIAIVTAVANEYADRKDFERKTIVEAVPELLALLSERERLADINGRIDVLKQLELEPGDDGYQFVTSLIATLEASKPEEKDNQ